MINLEREITRNIHILRDIIDDHSRYQLLNSIFMNDKSEDLYDLFELINSLNNYVDQEFIYGDGGPVEGPVDVKYVYAKRQYKTIEDLSCAKSYIEDKGEDYVGQLDYIKNEITKYEEELIFDLLEKIEERIVLTKIDNCDMRNSVEYLCRKLNKYNSYDNTYKNKILDEFCSKLLDGNNVFSDSLNLFKNYKELSRKLKIKKEKMYRKEFSKVKIEFKVWQNQDMNLLSVYNLEYYLILEEFYQKNSVIEIGN